MAEQDKGVEELLDRLLEGRRQGARGALGGRGRGAISQPPPARQPYHSLIRGPPKREEGRHAPPPTHIAAEHRPRAGYAVLAGDVR